MIESPVESIIRKIEGDTETYICNRLMELNIDKDILMNQTQEIKRLNGVIAEYERLEEQGLLLRLPCKVGDTVFFVGNEFINDYEIRRYIVDESGITVIQIAKEIDGKDYWNSFSIDDIGKSIFFTYVEAELELANRLQSHAEAIMDERNGR